MRSAPSTRSELLRSTIVWVGWRPPSSRIATAVMKVRQLVRVRVRG